ncbi:MAG: hypothetical protein ABIE70_02485 [bacterium]
MKKAKMTVLLAQKSNSRVELHEPHQHTVECPVGCLSPAHHQVPWAVVGGRRSHEPLPAYQKNLYQTTRAMAHLTEQLHRKLLSKDTVALQEIPTAGQ